MQWSKTSLEVEEGIVRRENACIRSAANLGLWAWLGGQLIWQRNNRGAK